MRKYWDSIKIMLLAIFVLPLGFIWDDLALISSIAFITFIIMAAHSAFTAASKQSFNATLKLLSVFSAVLALLIVLGFTVMNPPQCLPNHTPKNEFECIVGANIGLGVYFMFIVFPAAIGLIAMWVITLSKGRKKS